MPLRAAMHALNLVYPGYMSLMLRVAGRRLRKPHCDVWASRSKSRMGAVSRIGQSVIATGAQLVTDGGYVPQ